MYTGVEYCPSCGDLPVKPTGTPMHSLPPNGSPSDKPQPPNTPKPAKALQRNRNRTLLRRYMKQFQMFRTPAMGKPSMPTATTRLEGTGFKAATFAASIGYAIEGLGFAFKHERNFRIDCMLIATAIALGIIVELSLEGWAILLQMSGFVLFAELANTVVEWLVDLLTGGTFDLRAKRIKDIAAGACLIVALASYGVVAIVFYPYILTWFSA
jgi:undecaprenol kinase